ncbi:uncharacterized protein LOC129724691 [Wyeomyia smithii]|uniref:uncharacterized protein LOC129724691 n=1 Tax=Wyeomyia smithii TaxID=174621 RepID=UPI0024680FE2|nr:uncharacterized protein LOC129724691 [Wyeomyia smithii]
MAHYKYAIFLLLLLSNDYGVLVTAFSSYISAYVVCPEGEFVFLPAENCNQFYFCADGVPTKLYCAEEQNFNPESGMCEDDYECETAEETPNPDTTEVTGTTSISSSVSTSSNPITTPDGFLPVLLPDAPCPSDGYAFRIHATYCNLFYFCREGEESLQQCAFLHRFDMYQGRCLYREKATCFAGTEMIYEH